MRCACAIDHDQYQALALGKPMRLLLNFIATGLGSLENQRRVNHLNPQRQVSRETFSMENRNWCRRIHGDLRCMDICCECRESSYSHMENIAMVNPQHQILPLPVPLHLISHAALLQ